MIPGRGPVLNAHCSLEFNVDPYRLAVSQTKILGYYHILPFIFAKAGQNKIENVHLNFLTLQVVLFQLQL